MRLQTVSTHLALYVVLEIWTWSCCLCDKLCCGSAAPEDVKAPLLSLNPYTVPIAHQLPKNLTCRGSGPHDDIVTNTLINLLIVYYFCVYVKYVWVCIQTSVCESMLRWDGIYYLCVNAERMSKPRLWWRLPALWHTWARPETLQIYYASGFELTFGHRVSRNLVLLPHFSWPLNSVTWSYMSLDSQVKKLGYRRHELQ